MNDKNTSLLAQTDHGSSLVRARFLTRLMASNATALSDAELLEMMLAPIAQDPYALAIRLLERFVSLHKIIYADEYELRTLDGVNDAVVQTITGARLLGQRVLKSKIANQPVIKSWATLMDYSQLMMAHNKVEEFRVLFLNNRHVLIADEVMHRGTINHTPVYPREIVKRGLELSAAAMILLHNHPSGDPAPSQADIEITKKIVEAAASVNIAVHDHVIVTMNGHYSFKSFGLMEAAPVAHSEPPTGIQYSLF